MSNILMTECEKCKRRIVFQADDKLKYCPYCGEEIGAYRKAMLKNGAERYIDEMKIALATKELEKELIIVPEEISDYEGGYIRGIQYALEVLREEL